ncbi:hypothetical protein [Streptomyces sp. NRRL F-5123]|uniref:hypothetical protein n=1 Tax=Streptomyces sp. NRRL F-5123 TaxID=1463856 RepID=UPI0004E19C4B|nr:hypothetical protein [Streptomyces sp. NRRL F-5123]
MKGPGNPIGRRPAASHRPVRGSRALLTAPHLPRPGVGGSWRRLAGQAPAVAVPVVALGHGTAAAAPVAVVAVLAAAHVLIAMAGAVVRHWFWWRARSQPARDLRRLLRDAESAQAAERLAQGLAARHQAVVDAYVRAHGPAGVPRPPRRTSRDRDDAPRRPRRAH